MNCKKLKNEWIAEESFSFKGWDFSHLNGRWENENLPWDYTKIVKDIIKQSDKLLDMGTGGGEFLLSLKHPYNLTYATEGYMPNFELCKKTLVPLGIKLEFVSDDNVLNFEQNCFDVVINRHEDFNIKEVDKVLKPGGYFITQQVGCFNNNDLSNKLIDDYKPQFEEHQLEKYVKELQELSYEIIICKEHFPVMKFFDIGALVYYAKIIEWEFPNFSVEKDFDKLCVLQKELEKNGFVAGTEHRFMLACKKPEYC